MTSTISAIRIIVKPHDFGDGGLLELRASIVIGGIEHHSSQTVTEDDLTSRFDYYFDYAKELLRENIRATRRGVDVS